MNKEEIFKSRWMDGTGPYAEVVISSRVRLARNIQSAPFPYLAADTHIKQVMDRVGQLTGKHESTFKAYQMYIMAEMEPARRQVMLEKHLISPMLADESGSGAVLLKDDESVSIMLNEEDHVRIQSIMPGMQLEQAWETADGLDSILEEGMDYSFHERYGYLTSCPTNVGTGLRASVMLHLPAVIMTGEFNRIMGALSQVGLAVRGLYGEGSEIIGSLVQVSNQITLGQSEEEIIRNLFSVTRQVIEQENSACQDLLNNNRDKINDRSYRALGLLKHARLLTSREAIQLLSEVRLGFELGIITGLNRKILNELLVLIRPACLQAVAGRELSPAERDSERALQVREWLKNK